MHDRKQHHSFRRIGVACLIALVVGAVGVSAAGVERPEARDLPASFTVPAPQPGDHAAYTYQMVDTRGEDPRTGEPVGLFSFDTIGAGRIALEDRSLVDVAFGIEATYGVNVVNSGEVHFRPAWQFTEYVDAGGAAVGLDSRLSFAEFLGYNRTETDDLGGVGLIQQRSEGDTELHSRHFVPAGHDEEHGGASPCGSVHALQGKTIDPSKPVALFPACFWQPFPAVDGRVPGIGNASAEAEGRDSGRQGWGFGLAGAVFEAVGVEASEAGDMLVYRLRGAGTDGIHVWFREDVPYPVQMVVGHSPGVHHVVRLSTYEQRDVRPSPTMQGVPAANFGVVRPWGPDASGVEHTFSAREAWDIASEELEVADLLDGRQPWRLDQLWSESRRTVTGGEDHRWSFTLVDAEGDRFGFDVRFQDDLPVQDHPVVETPLIWSPLKPRIDVDADPDRGHGAAIDFASIDVRAPTVASNLAALEAIDGRSDDWLAWSAELVCDAGGEAADCPRWVYRTGVAHGNRSSDPTVDRDAPSAGLHVVDHAASLEVDADGTLERYGRIIGSSETKWSPAPDTAGDPAPPTPGAASLHWRPPPGGAIAGLGALGIGAALLYYFRPGLMGLFSRIRDDEVLDHPSRRQLHDAVHAQPGIHHQALVQVLGKGRGAAEHHLRKLAESGVVRCRTAGGYRCYFPRRTDRRIMEAAPALRSATAKRVLEHVRAHPGATGGQVAAALGVTRSTVSHHVDRMAGAGVLRKERGSNGFHLWSTSLVAA